VGVVVVGGSGSHSWEHHAHVHVPRPRTLVPLVPLVPLVTSAHLTRAHCGCTTVQTCGHRAQRLATTRSRCPISIGSRRGGPRLRRRFVRPPRVGYPVRLFSHRADPIRQGCSRTAAAHSHLRRRTPCGSRSLRSFVTRGTPRRAWARCFTPMSVTVPQWESVHKHGSFLTTTLPASRSGPSTTARATRNGLARFQWDPEAR
jgi:hypothetical protein